VTERNDFDLPARVKIEGTVPSSKYVAAAALEDTKPALLAD